MKWCFEEFVCFFLGVIGTVVFFSLVRTYHYGFAFLAAFFVVRITLIFELYALKRKKNLPPGSW